MNKCKKCSDTGKYITGPTLDDCWQENCDCLKGKEIEEQEDEEWWDRIFRILRL